jgi:Carboxypeptidase regulatory-like domain
MKLITMACSLAALSTLLYAQVPQAQGPGRITGNVVSEDGQPIANANVCISTTGKSNNTVTMCNDVTDQAGHFEIQHVAMGSFLVNAVKEEDGYAGLNQPDHQNKVVLTLQEPTANVTIKLGPKAGMLIGTVRDSVTGKPVDNILVHYMPATDERAGSGTASGYMGGKFNLNLPTAEFIVFVSAAGYETWFYVDPSNNTPSLHLASGEQKSVEIELVPDPKAAKDGKR